MSSQPRVEEPRRPRRPYTPPAVKSEKMFETNALSCGKCVSGPVGQYQCGSVLQNS